VRRGEAEGLDPALRATIAYEEAWLLRALDRDEDAAAAYRRLLDLPAGRGTADETRATLAAHGRLELAELEADAGRYDEAARLLRELIGTVEQAPEGARALREPATYRLGVYEYSRESHADAIARLEEFIRLFPESDSVVSAHLLAGEALFTTGSHQRAAEHLRVAAAKGTDATRAPALLRLGECLAVLQHWARSEEAFAEYLRVAPDSELWFQARFGVAWARENAGRLDDAMTAYAVVVDRHQGPTAARAQFQIGECLYAKKQYEEAARELLKVDILYAYPEWSSAALYEAGRCFEAMRDEARARTQFEQVKTNHAGTEWARLAAKRLEALDQGALTGALPGR
jgi:TolA-binding protein